MKRHEKLLYQANSTPAFLARFFLIFNTVQTIFTLNNINIAAAGLWVMQVILFNIILSFLVFIAAAEISRYSLRWSYIGLFTGIFEGLRVFFISPTIQGQPRLIIAAALLVASLFLTAGSVFSIIQGKRYLIAQTEK
jgi:hypothetical protein